MSTSALLLVLAAAVAHAAWNVIAHGSSRSGITFLWWGTLLSCLIWVGAVPLTGGIGPGGIRGLLAGATISAVLHVGYMLLLQRGYAAGDLSTVYATARGTGPLLTVGIAMLLFGERPGPLALLGIGVILIGVVWIGLLGRPPRALAGAVPGPRRLDRGLVYGLLTGVAIAVYTVWDAFAVREWGLMPVAFMVGCLATEVPIYTALAWRSRAQLLPTLRAEWPRLLAFGVLSPLSYILVLTAMTMAPVSLVAPIREVSVVLVSLVGAVLFRERRPVLRVAAAVVVVSGVALLSG